MTQGRPLSPHTVAVLQALAKSPTPLGRLDIASAIGLSNKPEQVSCILQRACATGLLGYTVGTCSPKGCRRMHLYSLTADGTRKLRDELAAAGDDTAAEPDDAPPPVAAPRTTAPSGQYLGPELRPYSGRPGAMDAFAVPSLQGGQRTPRRAPIVLGAGPQIHLGRSL